MLSRNSVSCTPALVLGLGRLGIEVAADVESIFLRGDQRRTAVTCFLALTYDDPDGPAFIPVRELHQVKGRHVRTRREAFQVVTARAPHLRVELGSALRDLRTHERLNEAGLGDVLAPPLDLFIVADLTEPSASGALVPMAYIIQELLAYEPVGMGHVLLGTAAIAPCDEDTEAEARLYAVLKELDTLADTACTAARQPLAKALELEKAEALSFRLYLFDRCKEGTRAVKDRAELQVILGNFLLALLSGGLAQRLSYELPLPEMLERRAFYSGAAATALVFEPQPLIDACASRMGAEFIAAEICLDAVRDPRLVDELVVKMEERLGDLRNWLERLRVDTLCEVRAEADELHLGLHFTGFRFERMAKANWVQAIANHDDLFDRVKLPRYQRTIEENAAALTEELLSQQEAAIGTLPQAPQLYPSGLQTARRALEKLDERLEERIEALAAGAQTVPVRQEGDLKTLESAAWNFPDLPAFVARLVILCVVEVYTLTTLGSGLHQAIPAGPWLGWIAAALACAVTVGACVLWLKRKGQWLTALRDRCMRNAEVRHAALLEGKAREQLVALSEKLRNQIAGALEDLTELEAALAGVQRRLESRWMAYLEPDSPSTELRGARSDGSAHRLFRPSAADSAFSEWVYRRWRRPPEDVRYPLLESHCFLAGWRDATAEVLAVRLLAYGRQVFAPVWNVTLKDILRRRGDEDAGAILLALAQDAVPLLRPDFDRLGGGSHVHNVRCVLADDPRVSAFAPTLEGPLAEWEPVTTGDRYIAACCRVRHLIPLGALRDLTQRGRKAYEALESEERRALHLFDEWAELHDIG